jgi:FixJ family two-component response regulator
VSSEPTVFIVDDDPAALESAAELVRVVFPRVETYSSATEFLGAYDRSRPGCLVLDVAMPEMSGLELQQRLAEEGIELPVIFLTGHGNVQMAVGAMHAGAVNFLEKPFHGQDLWDSIRSALKVDRENRLLRARRSDVEERLATLTSGEQEVLDLILAGKFNKQIAAELSLSIRTVEDRRSRIMKKLGAASVVKLVQLTLPYCSGPV